MGASGWQYYTPYETDPNEALRQLKDRVFEKGEYFKLLGDDYTPTSIEQLLEDNETEGTHSILDMINGCAETAEAKDHFGMEDFGKVIRVSDDELAELLGTDKPTRAVIDAKQVELMQLRTRWVGSFLTVYDDHGNPSELYFTGFSGD